MHSVIQRVAAIHDLSGFGGGSLSAVIPILSAMGIQVCSLPTAILSTHTGGFTDFHFRDLSDDMRLIITHWRRLSLSFAAIYSGFLGSVEQIDIVRDFIRDFRNPDTLVVVDPVLGDDGRLYNTMGEGMVAGMRSLVASADVITPNITEAALLLGESSLPTPSDTAEIKVWTAALSDLGPRCVIITSVPEDSVRGTSVVAYDRAAGRYWKVACPYIPACYPGTGDIFASVISGSLLQGDSLPLSLDRAVQFVSMAIRTTFGHNFPEREGVFLERVLPSLNAPVSMSSFELI
ncbi:pyridoxamine kinase [Desulfomicrobium escambiense]|uniref:pyridoxamine kinase n=1 Tax=Desulfomicrobium escambiense TaxID=29503 RepID=UPI00048F9702|nr:pyridoxamine kinase [Desulfomicrobium escambiense]